MKFLPNAITIGRIVVTPVLLVLLFTDTLLGQFGALVLFVIAAISDYVDGKLAIQVKERCRAGHSFLSIRTRFLSTYACGCVSKLSLLF